MRLWGFVLVRAKEFDAMQKRIARTAARKAAKAPVLRDEVKS